MFVCRRSSFVVWVVVGSCVMGLIIVFMVPSVAWASLLCVCARVRARARVCVCVFGRGQGLLLVKLKHH